MKFILFLILLLGAIYASLWFFSRNTYPIEFGISFNQNHASYLGLDWKKVYSAMLQELKPKYIRIAAMWSEVEKEKGKYDFGDVDWMMDQAAKHGVKVVLVVGQKAPRWPECYVPEWARELPSPQLALIDYVQKVAERYRGHSALEIWQVENEPFIKFRFGDCAGYRADMVDEEIALVRALDPNHKIIITDSGELSTWRKAIRAADLFGTSVYRVVRTPLDTVFTYDWLPASIYRFKAMINKKDLSQVYISELQAEPWFTDTRPADTPIAEQEATMTPERLQKNFVYASRTGFARAYLWGVEWWYWMKEMQGDGRYWEMVRKQIGS